jgi:hypothetical protein
MASKTSQRHNFRLISKSISAFEAYFKNLNFGKKISGNQNGGLVQDGVIFEKKSNLCGSGHPKLRFF